MANGKKQALTTGTVAKLCDVAPRTVAKWMDNEGLKHYRIPGGTDRRCTPEDLTDFLRQHDMVDALRELRKGSFHDALYVGNNQLLIATLKNWAITNDRPNEDRNLFVEEDPLFAMMLCERYHPGVVVVDLTADWRDAKFQAIKVLHEQFGSDVIIFGIYQAEDFQPEDLIRDDRLDGAISTSASPGEIIAALRKTIRTHEERHKDRAKAQQAQTPRERSSRISANTKNGNGKPKQEQEQEQGSIAAVQAAGLAEAQELFTFEPPPEANGATPADEPAAITTDPLVCASAS